MHSIRFRFLCVALTVLTAALACNMPFTLPSAPVTRTMTIPPTQAQAELPTDTATPAVTATETLTPEPLLTPTLEIPVADVVKESNCRVGPGGAYALVLTFKAGDHVEIIARDLGGGFVFVKNPNKPGEGCWMLQNSLTISGNLTPLPAYSPPPSPTLAPNFTVVFKNSDHCQGTFTRFIVVNTGNLGFRSAYVKVTNLKNKEVTELVVNAFDLTVGCVVAQNIAPLGPGKTGYLQSDVFIKDPKGQKMQAVFQLCTEQGLKGTCVTQTLAFTNK